MKPDEQKEVKELRQRVRDLERALEDAHLDAKLDAAYLRLNYRFPADVHAEAA